MENNKLKQLKLKMYNNTQMIPYLLMNIKIQQKTISSTKDLLCTEEILNTKDFKHTNDFLGTDEEHVVFCCVD